MDTASGFTQDVPSNTDADIDISDCNPQIPSEVTPPPCRVAGHHYGSEQGVKATFA